jgi:uncharacterized protein with PIN domain
LTRQAFLDFGKGRHKAGMKFAASFFTGSPRRRSKPSYSRTRILL